MDLYGITDKGKVRQQNQDVFLTFCEEEQQDACLVVCDGMGGAKAGNIASAMASETFLDYMKSALTPGILTDDIEKYMKEAVLKANSRVYERSVCDAECAGMGTTLVAAVIQDSEAVVVNVGDSRAYHITDGGISQVTKDHSVVEDMIDRGDLTRIEAKSHPNKNLITRALGTCSSAEPDAFRLSLRDGDCLLLCTDGLSNLIGEQELLYEALCGPGAEESCERLVRLAVERGAPDNVTAVLFRK